MTEHTECRNHTTVPTDAKADDRKQRFRTSRRPSTLCWAVTCRPSGA